MTTVDVLRAARGLIEDQSKWTTGVLKCDTTGRMCALGAVANVLGLPPHDYPPESHPAVVALGAAAVESLDLPYDEHDDPSECVVEFNDEASTAEHHAKVITMFDRAIALAGE